MRKHNTCNGLTKPLSSPVIPMQFFDQITVSINRTSRTRTQKDDISFVSGDGLSWIRNCTCPVTLTRHFGGGMLTRTKSITSITRPRWANILESYYFRRDQKPKLHHLELQKTCRHCAKNDIRFRIRSDHESEKDIMLLSQYARYCTYTVEKMTRR